LDLFFSPGSDSEAEVTIVCSVFANILSSEYFVCHTHMLRQCIWFVSKRNEVVLVTASDWKEDIITTWSDCSSHWIHQGSVSGTWIYAMPRPRGLIINNNLWFRPYIKFYFAICQQQLNRQWETNRETDRQNTYKQTTKQNANCTHFKPFKPAASRDDAAE